MIKEVKPAKKPMKIPKRRPSVDIAKSFIELNLKDVIDSEKVANLSKKQRNDLFKNEKKANKKRHPVRNALLATAALLILIVGSAGLWWQTSMQPVNKSETATRQFDVDKGATTDQVATALQKAGFIRNSLAFKIYVRLHSSLIQAGTHMLSPSSILPEIADKLTRAETDEIEIQIPPGLALNSASSGGKSLRDIFKKYDYTDAQIDAAYNASYANDVLNDRPDGASLEGYIYPDTYRVFAGDSLQTVIGKALDQLAKVSAENDLRAKFAAQGLTFYQGLTLASIIEKEVISDSDRRNVAQVFFNRMNAGMVLGADATFTYAYNEGLCSVNSPDCDSAYNTRNHAGLPPGPISNTNLSALNAVANPLANDYYFYVSGDDGTTHFSETEDQHNSAVAQYCQKLCQ